jgi:uncharacterized protein YndB with AHSA1/START domain
MATESYEITRVVPAPPERVYAAWLDSEQHSRFTRSVARVVPTVGGAFEAWEGYIHGKTLELEPHRRIVQSWRTTEFPETAEDSRVELELAATSEGTALTLRHSNVPADQAPAYRDGWIEHYLEPLQAFFSDGSAARTKAEPKKTVRAKGRAGKGTKAAAPKKSAKPAKAAGKPARPAKRSKAKPAGAARKTKPASARASPRKTARGTAPKRAPAKRAPGAKKPTRKTGR